MKIALAQINPVIGDFAGNVQKMLHDAATARDAGCGLVVFPELAVCGYPPKDLLERPAFVRQCRVHTEDFIRQARGIGVVCGTLDGGVDAATGDLGNAAVLFEDGKVLHVARKRLLPSYDVFDETRYFTPGDASIPFPYKGLSLGLTVCEDAWNLPGFNGPRHYAEDPVAELMEKGADLLVNIAASPFHAGKRELRILIMEETAKRYNVRTVYVNQVGGNDSLLFDGTSTAHAAGGRLCARGRDFAEDLVVFDTETLEGGVREVSASHTEAVHRALVMGVRDYFAKCGFTKAVVGLSGGIDSALTLCLAAEALGPQNLTAIFMPSIYTSGANHEDTRRLAENLGVAYEVVPISDIYRVYADQLGGSTEDPTVVEQNLQARIRGNILMAHSNRTGALVLSTGNKSELAVGYSTLYGDMCGGLSVISDLPKKVVYEVSRRINRGREIIPQNILDKAPSAELKPDQRDDDDLPPYEVLDPILEAYVEHSKEPREIVAMGYDAGMVADVVRRVRNNEYKRRQAPPGLKITPKAFGEGRRYPIAQRFDEFA